jgi:hypothetical protein
MGRWEVQPGSAAIARYRRRARSTTATTSARWASSAKRPCSPSSVSKRSSQSSSQRALAGRRTGRPSTSTQTGLGVGEHHRPRHRRVAGAAGGRAQPGRAVDLQLGVDRRGRSPAGLGVSVGEDAVGPVQLQALDPQPLDPDRHRQPLAGGGRDRVAGPVAADRQLQPGPVGGQRATGTDGVGEGGDREGLAPQVGVDPPPPWRVGEQRAPGVGEPDVGAGGRGQPQPAAQQVVVEDGGALDVAGADEVDRVDQPQGGVGDQLAGLHRSGVGERPGGRAVGQGREHTGWV